MLTKEEIEKRLEKVDPQLCVAFASRCALRALPMLATSEDKELFWYWQKNERSKHLLSVFRAVQVSTAFSVFGRTIDYVVIDAFAAAAEAFESPEVSSAYAALAASSALYAVALPSFSSAASSAEYTFLAFDNIPLERVILNELDMITQFKNINVIDYFYASLWPDEVPSSWLGFYNRFNGALLELDEGFDIWRQWYKDRLNGTPLDLEQEQVWLNIPAEILEEGAKASNNYLSRFTPSIGKCLSLKPLNLVRAIFIGNGAAGKTSLIRRLHGEPVIEDKEEMTPGIEIREWSVPNSEIKARFWDFGGQVMSHATHQFFLRERCLYILVVDAGSEREIREDKSSDEQAEYWLEHIKAFSENAPVMLVGNKDDKATVKLSVNRLKEKYPNIVLKDDKDIYPISCTKDNGLYRCHLTSFVSDLSKHLKAVGTHQIQLINNEFEMLHDIRKWSRKNNFLSQEQFNKLCDQHKIGEEGLEKQAFLGVMDSLGEIVHFKGLKWHEAYVLNPRWLTYGVYTLLYSKQVKRQQGVLSDRDVVNILSADAINDEVGHQLHYPPDKCVYIIDAMERFKLCYRLSGKLDQWVFPDRLPKAQPDLIAYFDKQKSGTLTFEFDFSGLLPRNIMPNLIVAKHDEILRDMDKNQLVWQRGVVFFNEKYQSHARLQVDYGNKKLYLWIQGQEPREYLVILKDEIYKVLKKIKGLTYKEYVYLPKHACLEPESLRFDHQDEKATYDRLMKKARRGDKIVTSDAGIEYDLKQVLGFIMTEEQQKIATNKTVNNFNGPTTITDSMLGGEQNNEAPVQKSNVVNNNQPNHGKSTENKWYKQWWFVSLMVGIVCGALMGYAFQSAEIGVGVGMVVAVCVAYFNPLNRLYRLGSAVMFMTIFHAIPLLNLTVEFKEETLNGQFGFLLNWGKSTNIWLTVIFVGLAMFLFWLGYKERKDSHANH